MRGGSVVARGGGLGGYTAWMRSKACCEEALLRGSTMQGGS
jgi:hypothetical protein